MNIKEFLRFTTYIYTDEEALVFPKFIEYIEKAYNVSVYKIQFKFNGVTSVFDIFLKTNADRNKICGKNSKLKFPYSTLLNVLKNIIHQNNLDKYFHADLMVIFISSYEFNALYYCYTTAFESFKLFKAKHFNEHTMQEIAPNMLYIVYKTKDFMEDAKETGEQTYLKKEYYKFIKQYDRFNMITYDRHLLVYFDYVKPGDDKFYGRYLNEKYLELLGEV